MSVVVLAAFVAAQLFAISALVRARGAAPSARRGLARQVAFALALFLAVDVGTLLYERARVASALASDGIDSSQSARILAQEVSETINGAAFAIAGALFPAGVMFWLSRSSRTRR